MLRTTVSFKAQNKAFQTKHLFMKVFQQNMKPQTFKRYKGRRKNELELLGKTELKEPGNMSMHTLNVKNPNTRKKRFPNSLFKEPQKQDRAGSAEACI